MHSTAGYSQTETLRQRIDARAPLPLLEALGLMARVCDAVGKAHRTGKVYGNLTPCKVLLSAEGGVEIIAPNATEGESAELEVKAACVDLLYLSPEQARGEQPVPASDVYALGVMLYEMLTGKQPFLANDPAAWFRLHRDVPPIPPTTYLPDIPPEVAAFLLKVLAKAPSRRYRTAEQMAYALRHLAEVCSTGKQAMLSSAAQGRTAAVSGGREAPHPAADPLKMDWLTVSLGLLAVLAVGGLVPLWLWVYLAYHAR